MVDEKTDCGQRKSAWVRKRPPPQYLWLINWPSLLVSAVVISLGHFAHPDPDPRFEFTIYNQWQNAWPKQDDTVPFWGLAVFGALISLFIGGLELVLNRSESRSWRILFAINLFLGVWESFLLANGMAEFGKSFVGALRPDFRDRCIPGWPIDVEPPTVPGSDGVIACTNTDTDTVEDGRRSYPSGHASSSYAIGVYATCYIMWNAYVRSARTPWKRPGFGWKSSWHRFIQQVLFVAYLFPFFTAYGISTTRIIDFKHSRADVMAGAFVGTAIGCAEFLRFVGDVNLFRELTLDGLPAGDSAGLSAFAASRERFRRSQRREAGEHHVPRRQPLDDGPSDVQQDDGKQSSV